MVRLINVRPDGSYEVSKTSKSGTNKPTATGPSFRMGCPKDVNEKLNLLHIDFKTAFLQGEDCDSLRDVACQLPPECGLPPYIGAQL